MFFYYVLYLRPINLTSIPNIKRVNNEQEDYRFEYLLACIAKDEGRKDQLRAEDYDNLGGGNFQYDKPDDNYDGACYEVYHMMKLVHCSLCIV